MVRPGSAGALHICSDVKPTDQLRRIMIKAQRIHRGDIELGVLRERLHIRVGRKRMLIVVLIQRLLHGIDPRGRNRGC